MAKQAHRRHQGFTLLEALFVLAISTGLFLGLMRQYSNSARLAYDQNIRISTSLQVQAIVQTIGSELRMLGNGVPFDQANFQIGENVLSDPTVTEPLLVSTANAHHISIRLNETGDVYLLTQTFVPSTKTVYLTSVEGLAANDPIYITNSVVAGNDGFYGVIESVNTSAKSIRIADGYQVHPQTLSFGVASVLEEVPLVTFDSPANQSGITRDSGFGPVLLGEGSTMTLEYLGNNGASVALPLTNYKVINELRAIRVTVSMPSKKHLHDGEHYTATATQTFGIRNLNYVF